MVVKSVVVGFLVLVLPVCGWAAETAKEAVIDWSEWDRILHTHVRDGAVDYGGIRSEQAFSASTAEGNDCGPTTEGSVFRNPTRARSD